MKSLIFESPFVSATCPENNVAYTGSDLMLKMFGMKMKQKRNNVPSWSECSKWCNTLNSCQAWTYSTSQRACTAKTNNERKRMATGFVSGSKECKEGG